MTNQELRTNDVLIGELLGNLSHASANSQYVEGVLK